MGGAQSKAEPIQGGFSLHERGVIDHSPLDIPVVVRDDQEPEPVLDQIVNIGKWIWDLVQKNKPAVSYQVNKAQAMPKNVANWAELQSWQPPRTAAYTASYKNAYGSEVVRFKFRVFYLYGGNLDGKGAYLANVSVIPDELNVAWGYSFDAKVEVPEVVNVGTKENPMAGMTVQLTWSVDTMLKHAQSTVVFFITGDGAILPVNLRTLSKP